MATVTTHGKSWRVQIRRLGHKDVSKSFPKKLFTKQQAWAWAERVEREILGGSLAPAKHTLKDAFDRYAREVSPKKRGGRWERYRLLADGFQKAPMVARPIGSLTAADLSAWRDARLRSISGASVRREMNLIASVLEIARREWKWIQANPIADVRKPPNPRSRRRRVSEAEIEAVCKRLTGPRGLEIAAGFRLGIESGMRAGEMWSLEAPQIDIKRSVVHLLKTKNGDERDVALTPQALEIVSAMLTDGRSKLFLSTNAVRDTLFRKARDAAGVVNLHFHDSRTEAIFRLSKKLDVLELARQIGHRDIRSLMFYYQSDAEDLAKKLAAAHKPKRHRQTSADRKKNPKRAPA